MDISFGPAKTPIWSSRPDMESREIFIVAGDPEDGQTLPDLWNSGIEDARSFGAKWIFFQEPGVQRATDSFDAVAPALRVYDAVWGGMLLTNPDGEQYLPGQSCFTCDDFIGACHMAMVWWVGCSHFVRTEVAAALRFDCDRGAAWFADYLLRIWRTQKCLKTAQPFVVGTDALPAWSTEERHFVTEFLNSNPHYMTIEHSGHTLRLPYTGLNPTLERTQLRGVFFEQRELEGVAAYVPPGAVIVDVGANTGNHTVFFACILMAALVIPLEPNPQAVTVLTATIAANDLTNVDTSRLGVGVGEQSGQMFVQTGRRGHLGTVRLAPQGDLAVQVIPLDALISETVDFIKIDVENMEMAVLSGARQLFGRDRPVALVEVQDDNAMPFLAFIDELHYRIERVFADRGYANYLIVPEEKV